MLQLIKLLFKRKPVFKQARLHGLEFVTVEYLGYANKALNLHRVKHGGLISIIHGGQIK